ncbi:MAG: Ig-like domain-containing protein [Methanomicrobiales archaeon]
MSDRVPVISCLFLAVLLIATVSGESTGTVTRSISPSVVVCGGEVTVSLTPGETLPADAWKVIETVPSGFIVGETTAFYTESLGDDQYLFYQLNRTAFTYRLAAPQTTGTYSISGTFTDADKGNGTVGGATGITVTGGSGDIDSITVTPSTWYMQVGEEKAMTAMGSSGSTPVELTTAEWSSDDTSIAAVTGNAGSGTATGAGAGTATISVAQDGVTGTATLTVYTDITDAYTDAGTGTVTKANAVDAVNDYLFNDRLSRADCVTVVNAYLFG